MNISLLKPGTRLTLETKNSVYLIKIVDGKKIRFMGGMNTNGEIRYPVLVDAIFAGSESDPDSDLIEKNQKVQIIIGNTKFATSMVRKIDIEAPDGSWNYSLDWQ